jgi:hypothetical protein
VAIGGLRENVPMKAFPDSAEQLKVIKELSAEAEASGQRPRRGEHLDRNHREQGHARVPGRS